MGLNLGPPLSVTMDDVRDSLKELVEDNLDPSSTSCVQRFRVEARDE